MFPNLIQSSKIMKTEYSTKRFDFIKFHLERLIYDLYPFLSFGSCTFTKFLCAVSYFYEKNLN